MSKTIKIIFVAATAFFLAGGIGAAARAIQRQGSPGSIKVGEKITYTVSFGRFANVGYAELSAVSRGRLSDREAVELRGRFKTLDFFSAAFYLIDESRTVFADAETGMPLYVSSVQNAGTLPQESNFNYLSVPAQGYDIVSVIYKIRQAGGSGALSFFEDGKVSVLTMQVVGAERVKTDAGEFDTSVVSVQSDYLTERGIRDFRMNLSNDEARIPAMVRFRTSKGEFKMSAASVQIVEPEPAQTPVLVQAPPQPLQPRPVVTPTPYIANQPLAAELAFDLGETLDYAISESGRSLGTFRFAAKERKQFDGRDGLLLSAAAVSVDSGNRYFAPGDETSAVVSPETLAPRRSEVRFGGTLSKYNQRLQFDESAGSLIINGAGAVDAPVGTHTVLSLFYALRSFNLKPSKDSKNPVNDTRVAVVWENQPLIFTLRPAEPQMITVRGQKVSAQLVSISTTNAFLNELNIRIWLGTDERRLPLMFSFANIQGELVNTSVQPR